MPNTPPDIWFPNLNIWFRNVPRYVISIAGLEIYWYAIWIVLGITSAALLAFWYANKTGQKVSDYMDLLILGIVLAFIGLRLYYLVFNWGSYRGRNFFVVFFRFREGGLAIYGGIIGALLAGYIISRRKKIPIATITDTAGPSLALGQAIGRIGNFFNREAFGGYTDNIFAMRIRVDQAMYTTPELMERVYTFAGVDYIQVHPTFLYEAVFNFILVTALVLYRPHKRFAGEMIFLYMLGYGAARFFIEGLRTDQLIFWGTGLPASQIVSVLFVVVAGVMLFLGYTGRFKAKTEMEPVRVGKKGKKRRK
ncbi:MAG: prolipoprotein diacylglyceryl transferase [Defluviitaleaceae bacterium]|nr:prolipoprotein diacylglyceryl transferase [Defluviitaleaceae bacterium]